MLIVRWLALFLLIGAAVSLAFYVGTGQVFYRRLALAILKWTVVASIVFFGVVLLDR